MKFPIRKVFTLAFIVFAAVFLSACTHKNSDEIVDTDVPTESDVYVADPLEVDSNVVDALNDGSDDVSTDEVELEEAEVSSDDDADSDSDESASSDYTSENDGSDKVSISGKFCYSGDSVPSTLRVYIKNAKTGAYVYQTAKARSSWGFTDLDAGSYKVYLAGPEDSDLDEGGYTDSSHSLKVIEVEAGDVVTGVEPCDFEYEG